jgi:hypothetical protein
MARQTGAIQITGTTDELCFYKMWDTYFVRMKSSLTGKRFWRDKAFERSRESSKRFGSGNRLASKLYRMIEEEKRVYKLFCFLKSRAILLLKEGNSLDEAEHLLTDYLIAFGIIEKAEGQENRRNSDKESINDRIQEAGTRLLNEEVSYRLIFLNTYNRSTIT